jgi:DNA-binding MarR family transcriptional regulator
MSLQIPRDTDYLQFCETPRNKYEIAKHFSVPYSSIDQHVKKLLKMGFLFVYNEQKGRGPGKVKYYLVTDKARAIVKGCMEATR